jgi:hypothetical protein
VTLVDRLDDLEAQSIFIFREAFARLKRIALLWSLGKDSNVRGRKRGLRAMPCGTPEGMNLRLCYDGAEIENGRVR